MPSSTSCASAKSTKTEIDTIFGRLNKTINETECTYPDRADLFHSEIGMRSCGWAVARSGDPNRRLSRGRTRQSGAGVDR